MMCRPYYQLNILILKYYWFSKHIKIPWTSTTKVLFTILFLWDKTLQNYIKCCGGKYLTIIYSFKTVDCKLRINVKNNIDELVFKIVAYYRIKIYDESNICMSIHFKSKLAKKLLLSKILDHTVSTVVWNWLNFNHGDGRNQ